MKKFFLFLIFFSCGLNIHLLANGNWFNEISKETAILIACNMLLQMRCNPGQVHFRDYWSEFMEQQRKAWINNRFDT